MADVVLAIGNPSACSGNTVTMGIVSALGCTQIADGNPSRALSRPMRRSTRQPGGALVNAWANWWASIPASSPAPVIFRASVSPFQPRSRDRSWSS